MIILSLSLTIILSSILNLYDLKIINIYENILSLNLTSTNFMGFGDLFLTLFGFILLSYLLPSYLFYLLIKKINNININLFSLFLMNISLFIYIAYYSILWFIYIKNESFYLEIMNYPYMKSYIILSLMILSLINIILSSRKKYIK